MKNPIKIFSNGCPIFDLFKFTETYGLTGSDNSYSTMLTSIGYTLSGSGTIFGNGATGHIFRQLFPFVWLSEVYLAH